MPHVTLDLVSLDNEPVVGRSQRFEGNGGTIGRDAGNTLALPDQHRRVSRLHAAISFPGGAPTITNSSTVLPIHVGGVQLQCGQAKALLPGMNLEIGPYVLVVRPAEVESAAAQPPVAAAPAVAPPVVAAPRAAPPIAVAPAVAPPLAPAPIVARPVAAPVVAAAPMAAQRPGADPFADLLAGLGPAAPAPMAVAPGMPSVDPLAALMGSAAAPSEPMRHGAAAAPDQDVFAALLAEPLPVAAPASQAAADPLAMHAPAPSQVVIPDDFNPFEMPSASARNSADPLAAMLAGSAATPEHALAQAEPSIDSLFAPAGSSIDAGFAPRGPAGDPLLDGIGGGSSPLLAQPENSDPLALFGEPAAGNDSLLKPMRDDLAEVGGAYRPPRALAPGFGGPAEVAAPAAAAIAEPLAAPIAQSFAEPVAAPVAASVAPIAVASRAAPVAASFPQAAPVRAAPAAPLHADALTQAFLDGAGLPASALPDGLDAETMGMIGSLLRSATAGAVDMLAIRANIKREVQASVTIIASEANNPLKFLPNADAVLLQLLGKTMPGFMRADEAMKDAFDDLRAHELGVIAGTRAALDEVLAKFDPAILGDRLVKGSLLEKALPSIRKTKLWDLYLERYAHLRREVEDDFQAVFGKAFVAAYEKETARMKARKPARGS